MLASERAEFLCAAVVLVQMVHRIMHNISWVLFWFVWFFVYLLCVAALLPWHLCQGKRTTFRNLFLSTFSRFAQQAPLAVIGHLGEY